MEMWREIKGTDGLLEISDMGRVRSNMRDGRILKTQKDKKGYERLRVTVKRQKMSLKIHREVAKAFIENPDNLPQVNHIDGNKSNNRVDNLEWASNIENARHATEHGLWGNVYAASKKTNENRKTPIIATEAATGKRLCFGSVSEAERALKTRHVSDVLNGKRIKAAGCYFERG